MVPVSLLALLLAAAATGADSWASARPRGAAIEQDHCEHLPGLLCQGERPSNWGLHEVVFHPRRSFALVVVAALAGAGAARARAAPAPDVAAGSTGAGSVPVYFARGSFWRLQHELVQVELQLLGRDAQTITARAGYAGGKKAGKRGQVCYHNKAFMPDYTELGHAEVVQMSIPENRFREVAKSYFDDVASYLPMGRPGTDEGPEFRSAIGLPGGEKSPLFPEIEAASAGRVKLGVGQGDDPDTAQFSLVWIYDSDKFPFYPGELYNQFHDPDDMETRYPAEYKALKQARVKTAQIQRTGCPENGNLLFDLVADGEEGDVRSDQFSLADFGDAFASFAPKGMPKKKERKPDWPGS